MFVITTALSVINLNHDILRQNSETEAVSGGQHELRSHQRAGAVHCSTTALK